MFRYWEYSPIVERYDAEIENKQKHEQNTLKKENKRKMIVFLKLIIKSWITFIIKSIKETENSCKNDGVSH